MPESGEITVCLKAWAAGDRAALDRLMPLLYAEMHRLADRRMKHERAGNSLQATALINEAYLKLVGDPDPDFQGRAHFFGVAARIMRRILTDHARRRRAEKRGGNARVIPLEDGIAMSEEQVGLIADLDEALKRLEALHPEAARVVELRFFGGLTEEECARLLGVSSRTVKRLWMTARAWLYGHLTPES